MSEHTVGSRLAALGIKDLLALHNKLAGKATTKFASRAKGEVQVSKLLDKAGAADTFAATGSIDGIDLAKPATKAPSKPAPKAKAQPKEKKPKVAKQPGDRSAAIKASWANGRVAGQRSKRDRVKVGGEEYRSTKAAFQALKLPLGQHIKFRMELKAAHKDGSKSLAFEHNERKHTFSIAA